MNTAFALYARYETNMIPLKAICEEFLNITPKTAAYRANAQALPFPVFRLREERTAPHMVKVEDLAAYIDKCHQEAKHDWEAVRGNA